MNDNLNAIRLCLAMLVLFSHSFAVLGAPQPQVLGWDLGSHAVHAFFAVSGYLIVGSYMRRPSIVQSAVNRILRIVPALLVAYVFGHVLFEWYGQYGGNPLPFRQNNSLWTIPWEITCYAGCAAAGVIGLLHRDRYNVIFAVVWIMALASLGPGEDYALILPMLLSFLTGGFIAIYEDGINMQRAAGIGVLALVGLWADGWLGVLPHALYFVPNLSESGIATMRQWPVVVSMAFCVVYLGQYAPPRFVLREDYSYGVYLFAWPTQQAVVATSLSLGVTLNPYSLSVAAALPTVCIAALSWHLIEKPALRKKRTLGRRPLIKQE